MNPSAIIPFGIMLVFGIYYAYMYWKNPLKVIRARRKQRKSMRESLPNSLFYKIGGGEFMDDFPGLEITIGRLVSIILIGVALIGIGLSIITILRI